MNGSAQNFPFGQPTPDYSNYNRPPNGCKYCGQSHPNIGMTIIPSCVDTKIEDLEKQIAALKARVEFCDVWSRLPDRIKKRISADDGMAIRDVVNALKGGQP